MALKTKFAGSGCVDIANRISNEDQDALLQRIDDLEAAGTGRKEAQLIAAQDSLEAILDERKEFQRLLREQHPDLFDADGMAKPNLMTPEGKFAIAKELADFLMVDGSFKTILEARKKIADLTGQKIEAATEAAKQADEAIETAVVLAGREIVAAGRRQGRSPQVIYDRLVSLYERQPNLAVRSSTSMRDQAYSTPVPLAYLAGELAGVTADTKMIESTAGNGMLAIGASMDNATINELNPKRAEMLSRMGFKPTTKNAATETLAADKSQDAVVINPPFGVTKDDSGETISYTVSPEFVTREVDHAIVFKTLQTMKDDGRAVLIVGGVQAENNESRRDGYRGKSKREFYFNLYRDYNVTDHFSVDGGMYSKQGASYPVDVIVINGRGKSARDLPAAALPDVIRSYDELKGKLDGARRVESQGDGRSDRTDRGNDQAGAGDREGVVGGATGQGDGTGAQGAAGGATSGDQGARSAAGGRTTERGAGAGQGQSQPANAPGSVGSGQGSVPGSGGQQPGGRRGAGTDNARNVGGPSIVGGERVESGLSDRRGEEKETETQVEYQPASNAASVGTLVPKAMRDSIAESLQRVSDQVGDIDQYVADSLSMDPETLRSNFSAEQIDALALSIQNAEAGKGFIIGDQTGIGKGRVVAAMIRYALVNDKVPIFVTEKPNLYSDMIRDLDDIGMTDELALDTKSPKILITNGDEAIPYTLLRNVNGEMVENNLTIKAPKSGAKLDAMMKEMMAGESLGQYKVIFTTYSQMQTVKGKMTERMRFVKQFGAGNYMIFDESHNAGGAGETQARTKEQRQAVKEGKPIEAGRASFVRELVGAAFGTFFSSATYAKRPDVMDLYSSTNMKLAVEKISQLSDAIKRGGVPMQQAVATMLTKDGQYIRRERTFAGVSYDTVEATVDKQVAENMARAMSDILRFSRAKEVIVKQIQKEFDKEGSVALASGEKTSVQSANFGSIMHNLIDQMLLALKAESSVKHAISRLQAGEKVVLTVSNTMGSFLKDYAQEMGLNVGDPVGLSFKDLYLRYLEKQRIIKIKRPGQAQPTEHRLTDSELGSQFAALYKKIEASIEASGFGSAPISPIDYMHDALRKAGFKSDEITGRGVTLNYVSGTPVLTSRTADIKQRVNAVRGFNGGDVDVLILNQAGSTGLSLHASSKFKDQRKRHMIVVQPEKNIDTHMQMLGRVHRTGQVLPPAYSQMMADIPAEMRPAAVLMKKMASLSANTTASRKSAVSAEGVVDFINQYGGQIAHEYLRDNPEIHAALGGSKVLTLADDPAENATEDDIRKLTGYIPILPIKQQESVYKDLVDRYNELIERENGLGTNKLEAKALDLDAETISSKQVTERKEDLSVFAAPANMERVDVKRTVKPFSSQEVNDMVAERLGGESKYGVNAQMMEAMAAKYKVFEAKQLEKMRADEVDEVKINAARDLMVMMSNHTTTVLDNYEIGNPISIQQKDGAILYGVITNIVQSGRTANPAAGSDWKLQVAIANGDSKTLSISFSQIGSRYTLATESQVSWYNPEKQASERIQLIDLFDKGATQRREKRWMVTGNLLAGFANYPGQIVNYTKNDGTTAQGVLMSRQYDFEKEQKSAPVRIKNADEAMRFFKAAGQRSAIGTEGGVLVIRQARPGEWIFETPSSKKEGGTYFFDKKLEQAIGNEFYKRGSVMIAIAYGTDATRNAIDHIINDRQETLIAISHRDKARELRDGDKQEPKFAANDDYTSGNESAKPDTSADARASIAELERVLDGSGRGYNASADRPYRAVRLPDHDALGAIAQAFGSKLVGFDVPDKGLKPQYERFNGVTFKTKTGPVVYLRAGTTRPHLSLLGHEIGHRLRAQRPDLYAQLVNALKPYIKQKGYEQFAKTPIAKTARTADGVQEEFIGEVLGDGMMDPDFWRALGKKNRGLLNRFAQVVGQMIQRAAEAVGYRPRTLKYVTDFKQVMEIAGKVMGEFGLDPAVVQDAVKVEPIPDLPAPDIRFAANDDQPSFSQSAQSMAGRIRNLFTDNRASLKVFNAYDKTLSTQYNKGLKDRDYGKVFDLVIAMQNLVSLASIRPAELAPGVLPRVDDIKAAARTLVKGGGSIKDINKTSDAIFAGTLAGDTVMQGVVWTEEELRSKFQMSDAQIGLYKQSRAAIDASLDELAAAEGYAMSQGFSPKALRQSIIDNPQQAESILTDSMRKQIKMLNAAIKVAKQNIAPVRVEELEATKREYEDTLLRVEQTFATSKNLKAAGYAPLMRFGRFKVAVQLVDPDTGKLMRDDKNEVISLYFGKFETEGEAQDALADMRKKYAGRDDVRIEAGEDDKLKNELYAGISPETIALFGEAVGYDEVTKKFYKEALTERSALKRRLERKGTAGYSNDLPRALSNFITSNSRHAAQRYYLRDMNNAIKNIPAAKGGVTDEAVLLKRFVLNPNDPAAPISSLLFAWFLGGSAAAAMVNLTQPVMMTGPYLSQYGAGNAVKAMNKAMPYALGKKQITDPGLRDALKRAGQEGIVDAQEIFHLYSIGAQGVATGLVNTLSKLPVVGSKIQAGGKDARARANAFMTLWGSMFSVAEQFNRKLTFLSAWEVAKVRKEKDPYAFAVRAVNETQGIYNKANRPNLARGPWGRVILTFKQYPIMYLELVTRMWRKGGPAGKKAALLMLATLLIASGEEGLPLAQDLDDVIDTLGQMMGFDTNMRRDKRRMARQILGEFFGDTFLYGISSFLPLDFSGRLGLGNIIPGTSIIEPANEGGRAREAADVAGPAAGLLGQVFDSIDAATEGNYGKAAQNLAPKAVKDVMAATEMATKGYSTDYKGRKVVDVTLADAAVKASGFNPTVVAQTTRKTMPIQQDIALQKRTESAIVDQWVRGIVDNDEKAIQSAIKRRDDWNNRNPDTQIIIGPQQIKSGVKSKSGDKDSRIIRQAPREMRGRIAEELQE